MADLNIGQQPGVGAGGPGGGAAPVRIPIVPTVTAPLRDAPPVNRWRGSGIPPVEPLQTQGLFEGIEGAGEKLGKIMAAQGATQRALQANKLISDFGEADTVARTQASANGSYILSDPNSMVSLYKTQADQAIQNVIHDPANKGLFADPYTSAQVQTRLYDARTKGIEDLTVHALSTAKTDQQAQLTSQTHNQAITAGSDYSVTPDGSIVDGPKAIQARQDVQQLIARVKVGLPGEAAADLQSFNNDLALARGQSIAQKDPTLIDKFIANPGNGVVLTPQQKQGFLTLATETIRRPMTQIDAANDAVRAQLVNKYTQQAAAGKLDTGSLYHDATFKLITPEDYQRFSGMPFAPPSDPDQVKVATTNIKAATSPEELDQLRVAIASNPNIRGKEAAGLSAQLEAQRAQLKTVQGQAIAAGHDQIIKTFNSYTGPNLAIYNKLAPMNGVPTTAQLRANAIADFAALTSGVNDPAKIRDATAKVLKENAPDFTIVSGSKAPPLPGSPRPQMPGESTSAYAAYLHSVGIH